MYSYVKDFDKFFVGFDPVMKRISQAADQATKIASNYPPYNVKKVDENKYLIELAIAGFGKSDIEVEVVDDTLVVSGKHENDDDIGEYIFKGIGKRAFTRKWVLADNIEVKSSTLSNGILQVFLEAAVPLSKRVKVEVKD